MDEGTENAVTNALDAAIADVASKRFEELVRELRSQEVAEKVHTALRSLAGLQSGKMPLYTEWDALFYTAWYQPAHINLAYSLAYNILKLSTHSLNVGTLEVFDFGCGALAMQFGLALAAAEFLAECGTHWQISVISSDKSKDMRELGMRIWNRFIEDIATYPQLAPLQRVRREMKFHKLTDPAGTRWLIALHVAYQENFAEVSQALSSEIKCQKPDLILVTTNPNKRDWLYCPHPSTYERDYEVPSEFKTSDLLLKGNFIKTTSFRKNLWHTKNDIFSKSLSSAEVEFVCNYLTKLDTTWTAKDFEAICTAYTKR